MMAYCVQSVRVEFDFVFCCVSAMPSITQSNTPWISQLI